MTQAEGIRAAMQESLPVGTPSDWVAVGGADLFSEFERKVESAAAKQPNPTAYRLDCGEVLVR